MHYLCEPGEVQKYANGASGVLTDRKGRKRKGERESERRGVWGKETENNEAKQAEYCKSNQPLCYSLFPCLFFNVCLLFCSFFHLIVHLFMHVFVHSFIHSSFVSLFFISP